MHDLVNIKLTGVFYWVNDVIWLLQRQMVLLNPINRIHIGIIVLIDTIYLGIKLLNGVLLYKLTLRVALPENPVELLVIDFTLVRNLLHVLFYKLLNDPLNVRLGC